MEEKRKEIEGKENKLRIKEEELKLRERESELEKKEKELKEKEDKLKKTKWIRENHHGSQTGGCPAPIYGGQLDRLANQVLSEMSKWRINNVGH